jgi:hypothetical protein
MSSHAIRDFLRKSILARIGFSAALFLFLVALRSAGSLQQILCAESSRTPEAPSGALDGHRRTGPRHLVANRLRRALSLTVSVCVVSGCGLIGLAIGTLAAISAGGAIAL